MSESQEHNQPQAEKNDSVSFYANPVWKKFYAFVLGPFLVASVAIGVYVVISLMTGDNTTPGELVGQLRNGGHHQRWQAAFALTKHIQPGSRDNDESYRQRLADVRVLGPELKSIFEDTKVRDPQVRRYLALTFGYLRDKRWTKVLTGALDDEDSETVVNSLIALTMLEDVSAVPAVIRVSKGDAPELRSVASYVLGVLGTADAVRRLEELLGDNAPSVKWNAAFALARYGNNAGEEIIAEILDRGPLAQTEGLDAIKRQEQFFNAIRSASRLKSEKLHGRLVRIAENDKDIKAQGLAKKLLARAETTGF